MLRTALQPRWLALLAVVVVVCIGFGWLGSWQLGVARDRGEIQALREAQGRPAVPIDEVLTPQRSFTAAADGRRVTAQGTYEADKQVLVSGRLQPGGDGAVGWWVVGAFRTSAGAWLPVVRGWVGSPDDPAADATTSPSGTVTVQGVLQPDEPPAQAAGAADGRLASLDVADLVNRWGTPIYNAFLVLTSQRPDVRAGAQPQLVPPPEPQSHGIAWRNAAYAVQWWVFAGFVLVMWWKMVQQAARDEAAARGEEAEREQART